MATTLKTYYNPSNIASDSTKLIKVYDSENPSESALQLFRLIVTVWMHRKISIENMQNFRIWRL